MEIKIRSASLEDAESFARISAVAFALACPPNTPQADLEAYIRSELSRSRFLEHLASPAKSFFAAEFEGSIVGYLMLCREEYPAGVTAQKPLELRRLYVLPEFHGTGVAAKLMSVALQQAIAGNHDAVWLGVSKHNSRAIAFYRKHGFIVVGEQNFEVGHDLHEDFIMFRAICPAAVDLKPLSGTEDEKSRVLEIYGECAEFFNLYKGSDATERDVESLFNKMPEGTSEDDKAVYGIFLDGAMIGVVDLIHDYPQKDTGFIGLFLLKGSLQRRGLGKKTWLAVEQLFKFQEFRLVVASTNLKAFAFWRAMGFRETGKRTRYSRGAFSGITHEMLKINDGNGQPE